MTSQFTATGCHDEAEHAWYVHTSDLPGLHTEAPTLDALAAIIEDLAPDLITGTRPKPAF